MQSALYTTNHCFVFPLLFFAVLYLLVCEFLIVTVNCVKELGPFCQLWSCAERETCVSI